MLGTLDYSLDYSFSDRNLDEYYLDIDDELWPYTGGEIVDAGLIETLDELELLEFSEEEDPS